MNKSKKLWINIKKKKTWLQNTTLSKNFEKKIEKNENWKLKMFKNEEKLNIFGIFE